ncbi:centriolin isoform x3 [Diplodia corticola]|uniref:Centriolin isoform x3 n=1 Tax=Diplodia corticola TaxID=236234 RepID=A0A1J9RMM8_9PEZI|nr:centriolin isoform x3 [Diplodia corticola]OJD29172.1 centriolin isoform x3 [Diplodia corticola]
MASIHNTDSALRIIRAAFTNAISGKGAANGSPSDGATIMKRQAAQRASETFKPDAHVPRSHGGIWSTNGPIPPDDGYGDVDLKIAKISEIETHFHACFAEVLASDHLRVEEALCMPLDLLAAIERLVKDYNLDIDRFKSMALNKIKDTGGALTLSNVLAIEQDIKTEPANRDPPYTLTCTPVWRSGDSARFNSSNRVPSAYLEAQNGNSSTTTLPATPTSFSPLTTADSVLSSSVGAAANQSIIHRGPMFVTPAKRNISLDETSVQQRRPQRPSTASSSQAYEGMSLLESTMQDIIDRAVNEAEARHMQEQEAMEANHQVDLQTIQAHYSTKINAIESKHQEQHQELAQTARMNRAKEAVLTKMFQYQCRQLAQEKADLEAQIVALKDQKKDVEKHCQNLEAQNKKASKLQDDMKKLQDDKKKLQDDNQKLQDDNQKLQDDNQKLQDVKQKLVQDVQTLQNNLDMAGGKMRNATYFLNLAWNSLVAQLDDAANVVQPDANQ